MYTASSLFTGRHCLHTLARERLTCGLVQLPSWPQLAAQFSSDSSEKGEGSSAPSADHPPPPPFQQHTKPAEKHQQAPATDLFTQALQSKAERQLRQMLEQQSRLNAAMSTQPQHASEGVEVDEYDEDEEDKVRPSWT